MKSAKRLKFYRRPNIGVVIYTFNRVVDAAINIELIRSVWQQSGLFGKITIVHAYNGKRSWYPKTSGEDVLVRMRNPGHFQGAADLIDAGIGRLQRIRSLDYIIVLAADTWLLKPKVVGQIIQRMRAEKLRLATCPWGVLRPKKLNTFREAGMATDFFIFDARWQRQYKMFPLRYVDFKRRNSEALYYAGGNRVMVERLAWVRFIQAVERETGISGFMSDSLKMRVLEITQRKPVHKFVDRYGRWIRFHSWPSLGLVTHHNLKKKVPFIRTVRTAAGPTIRKLTSGKV